MAPDIIERWKAYSMSFVYTALTIYPCQIRVHQRWQSKLKLLTAWKKEWRPATADSSPHAVTCQHCDTHYFSIGLEPTTFRLLVRRVTSSATDSSESPRPITVCLRLSLFLYGFLSLTPFNFFALYLIVSRVNKRSTVMQTLQTVIVTNKLLLFNMCVCNLVF